MKNSPPTKLTPKPKPNGFTSLGFFGYNLADDKVLCALPTKPCSLPDGAIPLCYANQDTESPTQDQFCGYLKDGDVIPTPGCCNPVCPSSNCPSVPHRQPSPIVSSDGKSLIRITDTSPSGKGFQDVGCVKTCPFDKSTFASKPYCYSNDIDNPNQDQVCAYETGDGSLTVVEGCCDKVCPSPSCPNQNFAPPEMIRNIPIQSPVSKLVKLMLIILAILVVSSLIFSLAGASGDTYIPYKTVFKYPKFYVKEA